MTTTIFTPVTLTSGSHTVLTNVSWLPHANFQRFVTIWVDKGTLTGLVSVEVSPDLGTTWLAHSDMADMTTAGGPYACQVPFDQIRVSVASGTGAGTLWYT